MPKGSCRQLELGRQLGIYFSGEDCQKFLDFAKTTGSVVALPWKSPTADFSSIDLVDDENLVFFLFNRGISSNLVTRYVTKQSSYFLDPLQSSVIEFSGSPTKDNTMFPGRIWAEFTFLNTDHTALLPKEPEFSKWYDLLASWIRKNSERVSWTDVVRHKTSICGYAGAGAQKFYDSGGRLSISFPSAKPNADDKHLARILYRNGESYATYLQDLARRKLARPKERMKLTCQICGERFFYSRNILHQVKESTWTICCPKVCPGCGEIRKLQGGVYPSTHACGWNVMKDETYKQKDHAPIEKTELEWLRRYLGIE